MRENPLDPHLKSILSRRVLLVDLNPDLALTLRNMNGRFVFSQHD